MVRIKSQKLLWNAVQITCVNEDIDQFIQPIVDGVQHTPVFMKQNKEYKLMRRGKRDVKDHVVELKQLGKFPGEDPLQYMD